jgi:hypothetical protein
LASTTSIMTIAATRCASKSRSVVRQNPPDFDARISFDG